MPFERGWDTLKKYTVADWGRKSEYSEHSSTLRHEPANHLCDRNFPVRLGNLVGRIVTSRDPKVIPGT
jgi:hypothetical protein